MKKNRLLLAAALVFATTSTATADSTFKIFGGAS